MRQHRFALALSFLLLAAAASSGQNRRDYPLPRPGVPGSVGVNIHFTDPGPGEMDQLAAAGFRWVRQDFFWSGIERERGRYDFSEYDRLIAQLKPRRVRPIFILDYGNDIYQEGSPRNEESRAAFGRFAAAAVRHFKGQGVLWEMWNEPNIGFWKPTPSVDEYILLALATGKAIRKVAPDEWYIGPGVSGMDFDFMEKCFKAGLLEYWDAVSFHPYRNTAPETATPDFIHLRDLVARYAPQGRRVPILSSEWGYSEKYPGLDLDKQSRYIARQALSNVANGLVVSIWYDWHDDGVDAKEPEHHFGTVYTDYKPKPTYQAMVTLTHALAGSVYNKRLSLGSDADYCLLFDSGAGPRLAVWTIAPKSHAARIPAGPGTFRVTDFLGAVTELRADTDGLPITLTDAPQYLAPQGDNALLGRAARWGSLAQHVAIGAPAELRTALKSIMSGRWNAEDRDAIAGVDIRLMTGGAGTPLAGRDRPALGTPGGELLPSEALTRQTAIPYSAEAPIPVRVTLRWKAGGEISQEIVLTGSHPLRAVPQPEVNGRLPVRVDNPTGAPFSGRIRLASAPADRAAPLSFTRGQLEQTVNLPVDVRSDGSYRAGVRIEARFPGSAASGQWTTVSSTADVAFKPLESFMEYVSGAPLPAEQYRVLPDGDPKVKSVIDAGISDAPAGLTDRTTRAVRIRYEFDPGWKFLRLQPENDKRAPLPGRPVAFGAWIYGDGSGDVLNARYADASGQTFQPTAGRIDWRGWRFVSFSMTGENSGHWGGADDGMIHYPIHLDSMLLVDSPGGRGGNGTLYAAGFTLMARPSGP